MGSGSASSDFMSENLINSPHCFYNKTRKNEERDATCTWILMMNQFAAAESKYKEHVSAARNLMYMALIGTAKEMIKKAETNKVLTLRDDEGDRTMKILRKGTIKTISKESPADAARSEVDILSQVIACIRKNDGMLNEYASSFSGKVARYVSLTSTLTTVTSRLLDVMLLSDPVLTVDIMNTIMYQLNMAKKRDEFGIVVIEVRLGNSEVSNLQSREAEGLVRESQDVIKKLKLVFVTTKEAFIECTFTVQVAVSA